MAKFTIAGKGTSITLNKSDFVAQGGEGSIYIKGNTAYKICKPGKMIPEGKFRELSAITNSHIVKPKDIILDSKNKQVGYTMDKVPGKAKPLAEILTKTYRKRENVSHKEMMDLILQIRGGIEHIHSKNCLQVDGNELNYMVTEDYKNVYFIDVNSFETPNYPADAIMASVRDYHATKKGSRYIWTEESDWFSFGVISFYMFTGIHPFKGNHPNFQDKKTMMVDRMKANISVLNPEVKYPKGAVYSPFDQIIPSGYYQWYQAIFDGGQRVAPPVDFAGAYIVIPKVKEINGSNNFIIQELNEFTESVIGYYSRGNKEVFSLKDNLSYNDRSISKLNKRVRVCFTPKRYIPIMSYIENDKLVLVNIETGKQIENVDIVAEEIMSFSGRLYVKSGPRVYEVDFAEIGNNIMTSPKLVANVSENSTKIYNGVMIQNLLGSMFVSIFSDSKTHRQLAIKELNDYKIVDAKYQGNVLMVVGVDKDGKYDRMIFRFSEDWQTYDTRIVEDITFSGINFTVLDNGICVSLTEEEKIEMCSSAINKNQIKVIDDPCIESDMKLFSNGAQVRFAKEDKVFSLVVKK